MWFLYPLQTQAGVHSAGSQLARRTGTGVCIRTTRCQTHKGAKMILLDPMHPQCLFRSFSSGQQTSRPLHSLLRSTVTHSSPVQHRVQHVAKCSTHRVADVVNSSIFSFTWGCFHIFHKSFMSFWFGSMVLLFKLIFLHYVSQSIVYSVKFIHLHTIQGIKGVCQFLHHAVSTVK